MDKIDVLLEIGRRTITLWYWSAKTAETLPLTWNGTHVHPLSFVLDGSAVRFTDDRERLRPGSALHGDYFTLINAGTSVAIEGASHRAHLLLPRALRYVVNHLLGYHLGTGGTFREQASRILLHVAASPTLTEKEVEEVCSALGQDGWRYKRTPEAALHDAVRVSVGRDDKRPVLLLEGNGPDLHLSVLRRGKPGASSMVIGGGTDPRLAVLLPRLIDQARNASDFALDLDRERPILEDAARRMLASGSARMTQQITLSEGDRFEAEAVLSYVEEAAAKAPVLERIIEAADSLLKNEGGAPERAVAVLTGSVDHPFMKAMLAPRFGKLLRMDQDMGTAYRSEALGNGSAGQTIDGWDKDVIDGIKAKRLNDLLAQADEQFKVKQWGAAMDLYNTALKEFPNNERALAGAQLCLHQIKTIDLTGKIAEADGLFGKARNVDEWNTVCHAYAQLAKNAPGNAHLQERLAKAQVELKSAQERYDQSYKRGIDAFSARDLPLARRSFKEARQLRPHEQPPVDRLAEVDKWGQAAEKGPQKWTTTLLALFLGGIGAHHFYLNRVWPGVRSVLFCWTGLPALFGVFKGLGLLFTGQAQFLREYNKGIARSNKGLAYMAASVAIVGAGGFLLVSRVIPDFMTQSLQAGLRFQNPEGGHQLYDQTPGSENEYRLTLEPPKVEWSILDPLNRTVRFRAHLVNVTTGTEDLGPLEGTVSGSEPQRQLLSSLNLCSPDGTRCLALMRNGGQIAATFSAGGNEVIRLASERPIAPNDAQEALRWARSQAAAGRTLHLATFKKLTCSPGCRASFTKKSGAKSALIELRCPQTAFGELDLSNGRRPNTKANSALIGQRFLIATEGTPDAGLELFALIKWTKRMSTPELQTMLAEGPDPSSGQDPTADGTVANMDSSQASPTATEILPAKAKGDLSRYLFEQVRFPEAAKAAGVSGSVLVSFDVLPDGSIHDATVVQGLGSGCDEEALRVVRGMPAWEPATENGAPVKSRVQHFPVPFVAF